MGHFLKEIQFSIFFIRDMFLIWLTVYEILGVFREHGFPKKPKTHILSFHYKISVKKYVFRVKGYVFRVKESNEMGFKSKSAIFTYLPWQLYVKSDFL